MTDFHLLDVNVLIALTWPQHVHHARAREWFAAREGEWATTPVTESAFLRLSTNARVVGTSVPMAQALEILAAMHETGGHRFIVDTSSFVAPTVNLERMVTSGQVTDVHLVDLAAASGAVLATLDRGIPDMLTEADRAHVLVLP